MSERDKGGKDKGNEGRGENETTRGPKKMTARRKEKTVSRDAYKKEKRVGVDISDVSLFFSLSLSLSLSAANDSIDFQTNIKSHFFFSIWFEWGSVLDGSSRRVPFSPAAKAFFPQISCQRRIVFFFVSRRHIYHLLSFVTTSTLFVPLSVFLCLSFCHTPLFTRHPCSSFCRYPRLLPLLPFIIFAQYI